MTETLTLSPMAYRSMLSWCRPYRSCQPWTDDTTPRTERPVRFGYNPELPGRSGWDRRDYGPESYTFVGW